MGRSNRKMNWYWIAIFPFEKWVLFQRTFVHFQVGTVYIFSGWDWDTMTPWPCGCHKISAWAESLGRFIEAKAPTHVGWKRVESNVGKWSWFIFLTSHDAIFLPKKTQCSKKEFLRESRLRKLGALLSFEFMSPPAQKITSLFAGTGCKLFFFWGTRLGAWDPFT